jgi:hypothetical protein
VLADGMSVQTDTALPALRDGHNQYTHSVLYSYISAQMHRKQHFYIHSIHISFIVYSSIAHHSQALEVLADGIRVEADAALRALRDGHNQHAPRLRRPDKVQKTFPPAPCSVTGTRIKGPQCGVSQVHIYTKHQVRGAARRWHRKLAHAPKDLNGGFQSSRQGNKYMYIYTEVNTYFRSIYFEVHSVRKIKRPHGKEASDALTLLRD